MALQHSELTPLESEYFADESKRVCLFHVMKGDRMVAEKVKLCMDLFWMRSCV